MPVGLLSPKAIELPAVVPRTVVQPYRKRLKLLQDAEQVFDLLTTSAYEMERGVPGRTVGAYRPNLVRWAGPVPGSTKGMAELEQEMDRWEAALEAKRLELCREILKIDVGDIAVLPSRRGFVCIRVESITVYAGDTDVMFVVSGTRFRKDGILGKRQESFYIRLEDGQRRIIPTSI